MIASGAGSTLLAAVSVPYRIRRSDRARRIRVSVDNDGEVEVVLPRRSPERHAEDAVRQLAPWIARRRAAVARAVNEMGRRPGTVPYLGETLWLMPEPGRTRVHRRGDELLVPEGDPREALERWYRRQAKLEIGAAPGRRDRALRDELQRLTIRSQRTRWASRSYSGGDVVQLAAAARARPRSSTTWSSTRWPTSRSWTTRRASGGCSRRAPQAGASMPPGSSATAPRSRSESHVRVIFNPVRVSVSVTVRRVRTLRIFTRTVRGREDARNVRLASRVRPETTSARRVHEPRQATRIASPLARTPPRP